MPGSTARRPWRPWAPPSWLWLLPIVVVAVARWQPGRISSLIKVLLVLGAVFLFARRPTTSLLLLVALVPFQEVLLAALYRAGVPAVVVRGLGFWKEAAVAGCLVAAIRTLRYQSRRFDVVDGLAAVYLAIVALYYLFPRLFVHPGPLAIGPPTDITTLTAALRNDTVFVALLLAVRRLPLDHRFRRRFSTVLFAVGTVVAAIGAFEFAFSDAWNRLMVSTIRVPQYLAAIIKVSVRNPNEIRVYSQVAGHNVLRIGSVFLDPLSCGLYLVIALAIGLERIVRGDRRLVVYLATGTLAVGILLAQTRAAIIAVVIVLACTLRSSVERTGRPRARYAFVVAAALVALVPLTFVSGFAARASGSESTQLHVSRPEAGARALIKAPLGRGLGTGATNGTRFSVATTLTSEDYYLQVGNETGAVSMAVFIALVVVLNRRLGRLARGRSGVLLASWRGLFLGLSLAALLLQVWLSLALAWTVWAGVAICLGRPPGQIGAAGPPASVDVRHYLSAVARRVPLILATVAAAVAAGYHAAPQDRRFVAESTVVIGLQQFLGPPGTTDPARDLTKGVDRQRQVDAVAVRQAPIATDAAIRAGGMRTPSAVIGETTVVAPLGTQLLRITVTDIDGTVARSLADGLAEALVTNASGLQQPNRLANGETTTLSVSSVGRAVVAPAPQPGRQYGPAAKAAAFALLAGLGLVILVDYLDVTVGDVTRLERRLGLPVLATVFRSPVP
jgi:hypothetical protein